MIKPLKINEYKNHGRFLGWGSGPRADWKIMFLILILLLIVSAIYSAKTFIRVSRGNFGSELKDSTESLIDKRLLEKNVGFYRDRKAGFEVLLTTKELTPDPSK